MLPYWLNCAHNIILYYTVVTVYLNIFVCMLQNLKNTPISSKPINLQLHLKSSEVNFFSNFGKCRYYCYS